jgi:hypothetical protein
MTAALIVTSKSLTRRETQKNLSEISAAYGHDMSFFSRFAVVKLEHICAIGLTVFGGSGHDMSCPYAAAAALLSLEVK